MECKVELPVFLIDITNRVLPLTTITMAFFGLGKKKAAEPTPQEAIQKLRETEEMLVKKQDFLEKKIESEISTARRHGTKNKRMALQALKRKKNYDRQLQQLDGTLSTIEFQREALENASTNAEVLSVMGTAAKALKAAHNHMDVDQVHDLMDDIQDQQEVAKQISEAISNPIGFQDVDEDDLLAELEELEQEELDKQLLDVEPIPRARLPDVPSVDPVASRAGASKATTKVKSNEDDDLAELEAWANA